MAAQWVETTGTVISALGFAATAGALLKGFSDYRRAEQWKRQEFVARAMKEFMDEAGRSAVGLENEAMATAFARG